MTILDEALWRTVSPLLDRALELAGAERSSFVDSLRPTAPEVAAALDRLLADHDRALASGFLADSPGDEAAPSLAGQAIGPYTLVSLLGLGGMGAVWRARRSDGRFEGDVAIKLLHPALLDGAGEARFRREGTILSRLSHPGIGRLFDAGVSPSGQPYLVLELVEGTRIDRWADARALGVRARIELFLQVAEAVAAAHASLVVHRDLKPTNILVDHSGRVKLLDFGIAILVEGDGADPAARSATATRALTPQYAAPEQLDGRAVTTATDVYALGVLLYELLAGRHPTVGDDATPAGLIHAVTQTEPSRMSDAVSGLAAGDAAERFAARGTTRDRLSRRLAGDLDTIVAKALKREPGERYATVAAFADDLRRHLANLPVRARPDGAGYRLRKALARHRIEAAAALAVVAALVAATAIALSQARVSARQRDRALADLARAEITNDFSAFLLAEPGPVGGPASRTGLWKRGEALIDRRFADDPELQAHLLLLLADRYEETLDYGGSLGAIERAFNLTRESTDRRQRAVATCRMARAISFRGEAERSDALLAEAFADLAREPDSVREEAYCRFAESDLAYHRGEFARAIASGERALELERSRSGPPGRGLALLNELGMAYQAVGRNADSDCAYTELFAELDAQGRGRTQPAFLSHTNWAISLARSGRYLSAAAQWELAVGLARELDPARGASPFELTGFAAMLSAVGRHDEAIAAIEEALRKLRSESPPGDAFGQLVLSGRILAEAGQLDAAGRRLAEAAELAATSPASPRDLRGAEIDRARATVELVRGESALAAAAARAALARYEEAKRAPRELLPLLLLVARAENARGAFDEALSVAERALAIATEARGDSTHSVPVGAALREAAYARYGRGETTAARSLLAPALEQLTAAAGAEAPDTRRAAALQAAIER